MRLIAHIAFSVLLALSTVCGAGEIAPCQVHVILFVPADVKQPTNLQPRIDQIVAYAETFFKKELERWGHKNVVMPFRRGADGRVEVTSIRGKQKLAEYKPVEVRMEVMDHLRREKRIEGPKQVWWILVYPGPPPARFPGFLGGFGPQIGGWAVCNFDTSPGRIDPAVPLGADFLEKVFLKGMIHELGHGFGLPHIGPRRDDRAGNTLMGPTHANFRRVHPAREDRVYLSEVEAALLSRHPAFRGAPDNRGALPQVQVDGLRYEADATKKKIVVRGRVQSAKLLAYALVADESDARPGEYWTKTYAGKIAEDGTFTVVVTEPYEAKGTFKTWFLFADGTHTGDGKSRGREGGVAQAYVFAQGSWTFP